LPFPPSLVVFAVPRFRDLLRRQGLFDQDHQEVRRDDEWRRLASRLRTSTWRRVLTWVGALIRRLITEERS
jgi:hypothetical protein